MAKNMLRHIVVKSRSVTKVAYIANYVNAQQFHCGSCLNLPRKINNYNKPSPAISSRYEIISDENASIIENTADEIYSEKSTVESDEFEGINLKRGINGVFDIEDLVSLLERENAKNIFVVSVSKEIKYVDFMCIVSGRSKRHILALAEFIRKVHKRKKGKLDPIPNIEGKKSDEWMALDLGNIALHIFSEKTRALYDLETLWAVGHEYDDQSNKKNEVADILENYSKYLKDLKPLS